MQNFMPQVPYQQFRPVGYKIIPIANDLEMGSITVEYNGTPTYFHNQSTDDIYVKYFDIKTGLTPTIKYVRSDKVNQGEQNNTAAEVNYDEQFKAVNERLDSVVEALKQQEERWNKR